MEQRVLRISTTVVVAALILRLLSGGALGAAMEKLISPEFTSFMLFLETGRLVRPSTISFTPQPEETHPPETQPEPTAEPAPEPLEIQKNAEPAVNCGFSYDADLNALLAKPLTWDLTGQAPTVLILHSHATESYVPTGEYKETTPYHTLNIQHNMLSVGAHLAKLLEEGGISVLQDTELHDNPSYDAAYSSSRQRVQEYLAAYPSIRLVLDLHRDSYEDASGNQIVRTVFSDGQALAQLMQVVGTDHGGWEHPNWQENFSLALKLQTQLEALCPGICRPINLSPQRYNQDLSTGALLIEVGASGNTRQEALLAAEVLAQGILSLAYGTV